MVRLAQDDPSLSITHDNPPSEPALDQRTMPFLESLVAEKARQQTSFHMPGHKGTMAPDPLLLDYWGGDLHPADLVEINGIIDYLHAPRGALMQAQQLAAQAYGVDHTFFLINGSTVGNSGAVMSASAEGDRVIMARASHRSVYGGVVLSGAMPVYIEPYYHPQVGFPLATRPEAVARLLAEFDGVTAVHITAPNYYGYVSDVRTIAELAHQHGAALLVDEAHGSHLGFHDGFPSPATRNGADMIIQSTHKTQSALTQASMLHVNDGRVNVARVAQVLSLLQSSSPSSILLASLDAARQVMATRGEALLGQALELAYYAREQLRAVAGLWCYGDDLVGENGIYTYDPTKLVVRVTDLGYSGFEVYQMLRHQHGIDAEFADAQHVIFSITIGDTPASIAQMVTALRALAQAAQEETAQRTRFSPLLPPAGLPRMALSPRQATSAPARSVPIGEAIGAVMAENIIPYPPGIPLIVPGEILDQERLDYLSALMARGSGVVGTEDRTVQTVRIVAD